MFNDMFSVLQEPAGRIALLLIVGIAVLLIAPKVTLYFLIKRRAMMQTMEALQEAGGWIIEEAPKNIAVEKLNHELPVLQMHNHFGSYKLLAKKIIDHREYLAVFYEGQQMTPARFIAKQNLNMTNYAFGVVVPVASIFGNGVAVRFINDMLQALKEPDITGPDAQKFTGNIANTLLSWFGAPDPARRLYIKDKHLFIMYQLYHNPYSETKAILELAERFPHIPELKSTN